MALIILSFHSLNLDPNLPDLTIDACLQSPSLLLGEKRSTFILDLPAAQRDLASATRAAQARRRHLEPCLLQHVEQGLVGRHRQALAPVLVRIVDVLCDRVIRFNHVLGIHALIIE